MLPVSPLIGLTSVALSFVLPKWEGILIGPKLLWLSYSCIWISFHYGSGVWFELLDLQLPQLRCAQSFGATLDGRAILSAPGSESFKTSRFESWLRWPGSVKGYCHTGPLLNCAPTNILELDLPM